MNRPLTHTIATSSLTCCALLLLPHAASAYVGPGAGLSLLGALWALIVAVAAALAFLFAWPIRRMRRRKREARELRAQEERGEDRESPAADAHEPPPAAPRQEATDPRRP
jgi:membrane protein implicated in regulation of membrane protease activity